MESLVDLVYTPLDAWDAEARQRFADAIAPRYVRVTQESFDPRAEERRFQLRVNAATDAKNVPFAALIGPDQERSGPYGGMSVVLFPADASDSPALIGMVVGTNGLAPDEEVLGRPGHSRKVRAICAWLRARGAELAWAKQDPVRIDTKLPKPLKQALGAWSKACKRYGDVLYAAVAPPAKRSEAGDRQVRDALTAFIDLFFDERGIDVLEAARNDAQRVQRGWLGATLPDISDADVARLLERRKYAIIEGPPGTGKTELATRVLQERYGGRGEVIQFHPGTTYESFIGGLAPREAAGTGFSFVPAAGHLMQAVMSASTNTEPYLLVVDEINRGDLSKVLGEAIYLFEAGRHDREVTLAHDFPEVGRTLRLPPNLHVLGTMNSADRSIAILDLAVRRRFAFASLWPQLSVVEEHAGARAQQAFHHLLMVFLEHASDDAFCLVPGHAYFLASDADADAKLATEVVPLLREYLAQGYVASFADEIQAWLDTHTAHGP